MAGVRFSVTDCDGYIRDSITETAERPDLTNDEKRAIVGGNAKSFVKL